MTIDIIIYMCIYICVCIVVFDILFTVNIWLGKRFLSRRAEYLVKLMKRRLSKTGKLNSHFANKLCRRLGNDSWLLAYLHAYNHLKQECGETSKEIGTIQNFNILLFRKLSKVYSGMSEEDKAFFAHIVYLVLPNADNQDTHYRLKLLLAQRLAALMRSCSVYVRGNAFRAIVKTGNVQYIYYAITLMEGSIHLRNSKFFSDYLTEFRGDMQELNLLLLARFYEFSPPMQVMIVNYLRLLPKSVPQDKYFPVLLKALYASDTHGETMIAVIRYFGTFRQDAAYEKLLEFLHTDSHMMNEFNYAAVAASSLRCYFCPRTIRSLLLGLSSPNWYVRFNCADSLLELGVDYETVIENNHDQYAKDILIHRSEVYKLQKGAKFTL